MPEFSLLPFERAVRQLAGLLCTSAIQLPRQPISFQKRLPHFLGQGLQAIDGMDAGGRAAPGAAADERTNGGYVLRQLGLPAHMVEIAAWIEAESV